MAQQDPKKAQGGPKKGQHRPKMTPRWLESYLEIIRKPREKNMIASGVHVDTKLAENNIELAPNWPQNGPEITPDCPNGLC